MTRKQKGSQVTIIQQQLPRFFMKNWAEQHHSPILTGREDYLGVDGESAKFSCDE